MPALTTLLADSWSILRKHPFVSAALGGAVLLSLASIFFGIGVLITPWFVCELFAIQLAILSDVPVKRTVGWFRAGLLVFSMVALVLAATWLAALTIGPDVSTADRASAPLPVLEALRRTGLIVSVTILTTGFIAPFQYAPLILIERGGSVGGAVLESAWLVRRGGLFKHWALAFLAQLLPLAPAIVAAVIAARTFERAATPVGVLIALPVLPLTIPFGQGILSAAYHRRRHELPEPRWTRAGGRPTRMAVGLLSILTIAPVASVAILCLATLRPAPPTRGGAQGHVVVDREISEPTRIQVRDTTLEVRVEGLEVHVVAGDGGGVGRLPAIWRQPVTRLRVLRRGDVFPIEVTTAEGVFHLALDRAATRVDDAGASRLEARLPGWGLPAIASAFLLSALLLIGPLERWGAVRRAYAAPVSEMPSAEELWQRRADAMRTEQRVALVLAIPSTLAVVGALMALLS